MKQKGSDEARRRRRWDDFRRRADHAPQNVYRHRARGWEYIPVHPFGDEAEILERLGIQSQDCQSADAWWGIDGDATLLESRTGEQARLFAVHWDGRVSLKAVFEAPFVTRAAFEEAMIRFADAGFPRGPSFQLRKGDPYVELRGGLIDS